jgi:hypothetical protein
LFLNDLNIPKLKVFPNTSIEEVNYQWEAKWYEKIAPVVYEIPYVDIHKEINDVWDLVFSLSKNVLDFSLKDNNSKASSAYVYSGTKEKELSTLRNIVWWVIVIKNQNYSYDNLLFDHSINEIWWTNVIIRELATNKIVYSYIYNNSTSLYESTSELSDYIFNVPAWTKVPNTTTKIGFSYKKDLIIPVSAKTGDRIWDVNYKLLKLKTLGTYQDCIVETPQWSSVFSWSVLKNMVKLDVYGKTFDFDKDSWTSKTDFCDYNIIYPVMVRY